MPRNKIKDFAGLEILDSWKIVQIFKSDRNGFAGICQIKLRSHIRDPSELTRHLDITKLEILTRLDDGSFIAYVAGKPDARWIRARHALGQIMREIPDEKTLSPEKGPVFIQPSIETLLDSRIKKRHSKTILEFWAVKKYDALD
jgi:hypothetical protein